MNDNLDIQITVLMPVYNASLFLREAIESILNQTYKNFEFIIINDGSTDNSLQIIESFTDSRIRLINNERNLGIIKTRNKGLQLAKGKYIANLDADDISLPDRFDKQISYFDKNPDTVILASRLIRIDSNNNEIGIWKEDFSVIKEHEIKDVLPEVNCIGQSTVMMRADFIKSIGYNDKYTYNEDWGLWLDVLAKKGKVRKLKEILVLYREYDQNTTSKINKLGVEKKIIRFKFKYLLNKIRVLEFNYITNRIFLSFCKDVLKYTSNLLSPRIISIAGVLKRHSLKKIFKQYFTVKKQFNELKHSIDVLFFFPSYHTGGAEKVHGSILKATNNLSTITFITNSSNNSWLLKDFMENSKVISINELLKLETTKRWVIKQIKDIVDRNKRVKMFGSNSEFYYELIPHIKDDIRLYDLTHAFVHNYESGQEKWSLPFVNRLTKRVVINRKTKNDYLEFYSKHNLSTELIDKIEVINNFVDVESDYKTKSASVFRIAYVGRGGEEKRIELIALLAKRIREEKTGKVEFHFVGDVQSIIPEDLKKFCVFHGVVNSDEEIKKLYEQFHVLVIASTREGFPMVIMEGMAHGVVPVCTNVGGIKEHVINDENGYLINSINEEDIINEFMEKFNYLINNHIEYNRLSLSAYKYAITHFHKELFNKSYNSLFGS